MYGIFYLHLPKKINQMEVDIPYMDSMGNETI